jgi:hypothetical protein
MLIAVVVELLTPRPAEGRRRLRLDSSYVVSGDELGESPVGVLVYLSP